MVFRWFLPTKVFVGRRGATAWHMLCNATRQSRAAIVEATWIAYTPAHRAL
jgi:hypothetical protein